MLSCTPSLKVLGHQINIFLKSFTINTLCTCANGFKILAYLVQEKNIYCIKVFLASWKTLNNSENCSGSRIKLLFWISFAFISCFSRILYIHFWFSEKTYGDTGGYQKAGTSSLKRVTGRIFTVSKWFHWSKQKLYLGIFCTKRQPNIVKTGSTRSKSIVSIFRTFKKYSFRDTVPF
jgi:hypothetical protein